MRNGAHYVLARTTAVTSSEPRIFYPHGFYGATSIGVFIEHIRHRLGLRATPPTLPPDPPRTYCTAWGGFGASLILSALVKKRVSARLWTRFKRTISRTPRSDFLQGVSGALPVLAHVGPIFGAHATRVVRRAHERVTRHLTTNLAQYARGESVTLGFAHGVAGTLTAYEIGCALLADDGSALRGQAIELLMETAIEEERGAHWPDASGTAPDAAPRWDAICGGGPGVCLAALLGYRYSGDAAYARLVERSIQAVALRTSAEGFCCGTLGRVEVFIEAYRTTGERHLLRSARQLFSRIDPTRLGGPSWQFGTAGHRLTALRLAAPAEVELPGLPIAIEPLVYA
jgi:hypothetical protein